MLLNSDMDFIFLFFMCTQTFQRMCDDADLPEKAWKRIVKTVNEPCQCDSFLALKQLICIIPG